MYSRAERSSEGRRGRFSSGKRSSRPAGVYCSREGFGKALTDDELYAVFRRLADQGASCIELVPPTHFTHALARGAVQLREAVQPPRRGVLGHEGEQHPAPGEAVRHPVHHRLGLPHLPRQDQVPDEHAAFQQAVENLGLAGYVQDLASVGEGFIPAFDLTGL